MEVYFLSSPISKSRAFKISEKLVSMEVRSYPAIGPVMAIPVISEKLVSMEASNSTSIRSKKSLIISEKLVSMEVSSSLTIFNNNFIRFQKNQLVWKHVNMLCTLLHTYIFQKNQLVWKSSNSSAIFCNLSIVFQKNQLVWKTFSFVISFSIFSLISEKLVSMEESSPFRSSKYFSASFQKNQLVWKVLHPSSPGQRTSCMISEKLVSMEVPHTIFPSRSSPTFYFRKTSQYGSPRHCKCLKDTL